MLILALESSAKSSSAAVLRDGGLLGQYFQNSGLTHSKTLMAMAESLLENLDMTAGDMDIFAVTHGPGSFTGVRIGVSAVKGLAWALDKPVCGVSSLEAMAHQTGADSDVIIAPVMDARREQVYNALFRRENGKIHRLCDDRAVSLADLYDEYVKSESQWLLLGDGSELAYDFFNAAAIRDSARVPILIQPLLRHQTAYGAALAALDKPVVKAYELEPFYLRPSQAERERGG